MHYQNIFRRFCLSLHVRHHHKMLEEVIIFFLLVVQLLSGVRQFAERQESREGRGDVVKKGKGAIGVREKQ